MGNREDVQRAVEGSGGQATLCSGVESRQAG